MTLLWGSERLSVFLGCARHRDYCARQGAIAPTVFSGREVGLEWDVLAPTDWLGPATLDPLFDTFVVTVETHNSGSWVAVRTEYTRDTRFTYNAAKMATDFPPTTGAFGNPPSKYGMDASANAGYWENFRFGISVLNRFGDQGTISYISPFNRKPSAISNTASSSINGIATLTWDDSLDIDNLEILIQESVHLVIGATVIASVPVGVRRFQISHTIGASYDYSSSCVDFYGQRGGFVGIGSTVTF